MQVFSMLEAINGLDLASVILRGKLLREIEDRELWHIVPGNFSSPTEAIQQRGKLSATQQNFVKGMRDIVFPYVRERLGMSVVEFWAQVGESQAKEILPILKAIITDKASLSGRVNENAAKLLDQFDDDKQAAIEHLIDLAGNNTVLEVRKALGSTAQIDMLVLHKNGASFILAEVTHDQLAMLARIGSNHIDFTHSQWTEDVSHIIQVKRLLGADHGKA